MNHEERRLRKRCGGILVSSILLCLLSVGANAATTTRVFFDDFSGISLDGSRWLTLDGGGAIQVTGGLLQTLGGPDHKRVDSVPTFAPMSGGVIARARIRLAGDYQKFGFRVNPTEFAGPIRGYYFDTFSRSGDIGQENHVYAVAWSTDASGTQTNLLLALIPVPWYEFHELTVERQASEVIFGIDGQEVARVTDPYVGALPVGVWNDRPDLMQTDWVEVQQIMEAAEVTIDIKPDGVPNSVNPGSHGVIPVAVLSGSELDAAAVDPATVRFGADGTEAAPVDSALEDVDRDGDGDLVLHFRTRETGISCGDVEALLTGRTFAGQEIRGADSIRTVGCR